MLDLELYLVGYDYKRNMKNKVYPNNYQVKVTGCRLIIVITYDEYIFFANNE